MGRLDNNLHTLSRHHPKIYEKILRVEASSKIQFTKSRKGPPVGYINSNDREIWLHSRFDPHRESKKFIDNQDLKSNVILIYGFACGFHIETILEQAHKDSKIIIIDPQVAIFKASLEHRDFVQIFADPRVRLLIGVEPKDILPSLDDLLVAFFLGCRVITHEASVKAFPEKYRMISQAVKEFIEYGTTTLYTTASISAQSYFNTFMNLPHAVFNPGVSCLKDKGKNQPAIVIGAGPSLAKNMHLLKDSSVIKIATGTILKKLLAEGIIPEFVCNIDYHFKLTKRYFQDLPDLPNTILVIDPRSNYKVPDIYPGPVCTWDNAFCEKFFGSFREESHGSLPLAGTVAQTCFSLAQYLGCDPIILTGLDLSYPGHISHSPGTAILDEWNPETNRFISVEDKEWEYFARRRRSLCRIQDIEGNEIYTDRQMFSYIQSFNQIFSRAPQRVIDASEQGALKQNAEMIPLNDALKQTNSLTTQISFVFDKNKWNDLSKKSKILELLDQNIKKCQEMNDFNKEVVDILEKMLENISSPILPQLMHEMQTLQGKLQIHKELSSLVNDLIQSDDYRRQKDDMEIKLNNYSGEKLVQMQIERDLRFIKGLRGGGLYLLKFFEQAKLRCSSWPQQKPEGLIEELEMLQGQIIDENH